MSESRPEKVSIVGAGLVGSLVSIFLARRGYSVEIFERRPDMRRESIAAGRSINLAVSVRGLHALEQVGLRDEVLKQAISMRGRVIHSISGALAFQPYGKDSSQCIYSISRAGLNQLLMTEAEKTGKVRIQFHQRLERVDFDTGVMAFHDERVAGYSEIKSDWMIGTDGSGSALRAQMLRLPGHQETALHLDYAYKELVIPPSQSGEFRLEKNALHIWPRGNFMLIALPNFDGSFTCTLFLPIEGTVSFETLKSQEEVLTFFETQFPDAVSLMPTLTEDFFGNPTGSMVTVKCTPWNVNDQALLLGDAAHAIVPFFGQGMNCGFEDCTILDSLLASGKSRAEIFSEMSRTRKPDSDAIADMAVENFVEMRDKVGDPRFLMRKEVEKLLEKKFPGEFLSRYALVTFSRVPYRVALEAGAIEDAILSELCDGLPSPDQVNLALAEKLIRAQLAPILTGANHGS